MYTRWCQSSILIRLGFVLLFCSFIVEVHGQLLNDCSFFLPTVMQKPLSAKCLEVVEKVFAKLDKTGDGLIKSEDLRK